MTLGQRLKAYREKEGLTQEQLAEYLNVSRQAVTKWEHDAGMPDIENLVAISRRMGVTLDELVLGPGPEKNTSAIPPSALAVGSALPDDPSLPDGPAPSAAPVPQAAAIPQTPPAPQTAPALPVSGRGTPSERARYHAFAALAFVFAAFCQVIAGCVTLPAAFHRSAPAVLPILNFCSAILSLYAAYVQAVKCSQYRQKSTYDPYDKE